MKIVHNDYRQRRAEAYPPIEEQLDMLWHAMNLAQIPKAQPFYDELKRVKDQFKKPT